MIIVICYGLNKQVLTASEHIADHIVNENCIYFGF